MGWRLIEEEKSLGARGGGAAILSDREQLWKCWALFLLFREEQPEPKQAFICSCSYWPAEFRVPGSSAEVAQTARRRWACKGVSHVWAFVH